MPLHFNISKSNDEIDNLYIKDDTRQATPEYTTTTFPSLDIGFVVLNDNVYLAFVLKSNLSCFKVLFW
jgi:hypothetical protein